MKRSSLVRPLAAWCVGMVLAAAPSGAQDVSGLTFDVSVTTGDSATARTQTGQGWVAGSRSRVDLRGEANPAETVPGLKGENISMLMDDSAGTLTMIVVDHDTKKFFNPARAFDQIKEMLESLPEKPRVSFTVTNVVVDTLGAGETISGFSTKRFRLRADLSMAMEMMGESMNDTMHLESEGDYTEELSEFSDPLQGTRGVQAFISGMPWMDSTAMAELGKITHATPRGVPLRLTEQLGEVEVGGAAPPARITGLSNIKRGTFSPAVFAIPDGYTEMDMPTGPALN